MLIFISDLHFVDGSAGEHNVPIDAFRIFFEDIAGTCDWLIKKGRRIDEIKLVFLGDIFDLLRTEMWFDFSVDERPWGDNEAKTEAHANTIFDAIIKKNQDTFDLLKGSLKDQFGPPVEPERIYVPGNHDRLCNKYQGLRDKVCHWLKIPSQRAIPFNHYFENVDYGVFARHGHEYDKFNYEGSTSYKYKDYMRMPIGDPITTELAAKLPWKVMQKDEIKKLPEAEQEALKRNFQEIENVRPFSATLEWLLYQVKKNLILKEVIEDTVDEIIKEFNQLEFVKKWYDHHDKWYDFWDEADKIQSVLFLLEKFKVFPLEKLMPLLQRVKKRFEKDDLLEAAPNEYSHLDNRIRYVVYGHTHEPLQVPLHVIEDSANSKEHIYLNTGTWRTRYHKCKEGLGFIGWKNLTYVIFYKKEERGMDFPTFETWTGTLKTV
jgi:UDP-2,3-diacylglucosamine pyrophosphatase LpxH